VLSQTLGCSDVLLDELQASEPGEGFDVGSFEGLLVETDGDERVVSSDLGDSVENVLIGETAVGSLCEVRRRRKRSASTGGDLLATVELKRTEVKTKMAEAVTGVVNAKSCPDDSSL